MLENFENINQYS